MATITFNGKTLPVNINLAIEAGNAPASILRIGDGKSSVDLALDYADLFRLIQGVRADPRFMGNAAAPSEDVLKAGKEAMKAAKASMDKFAKDFGL